MATRSPTETHAHHGAFLTAALLPNVAASPTQTDTLQVGDVAYVTTDETLYVCTLATLGAATWFEIGAAGSGEQLIFEWNGVDTSQFEVAPAFSNFDVDTLTVVADAAAPRGTYLQVLGENIATPLPNVACWLAKDPLPVFANKRNIRTEILVRTGTSNRYWGISFLGDDTGSGGYHGYQIVARDRAGGWRSRIDDGVLVMNNTTILECGDMPPGPLRYRISADKRSGAQGRFRATGWGFGTIGDDDAVVQNQQNYVGEPAPASWNPLICNRWGLAIQRPSSFGVGTTLFQINSVRAWVW
jgi:hypothetical protein